MVDKIALKEIILIFAVLLTVLVLALGGNARASPPDEEWNRTYGGSGIDRANHFQQTSDGGYIFAGTTCLYEKCSSDIRLLRTDSNGNEQWKKTIGLSYDSSFDLIQQTLDGGYILAGRTVSSGMTNRDTWVAKIDANGNEQWNRTFKLDGYEGTSYVWQTSDEGYVLAGHIYTRKYPDPKGKIVYTDSDALLIKTDKNGNPEWNKTLGGLKDEWGRIVQQTSDGGYILAGGTESYGSGKSDIWLVRTDHEGEEQWNQTYGGNSSDWANSVQETFDGGFIIAGGTESYGAGHRDLFLVKTDLNGNEQWNRTFGGESYEFYSHLEQTTDGGYILGGRTWSFGSRYWLIKTDADGNMQWDRTFDQRLESFLQISDGCLILTGDKGLKQDRNIMLVKTNPEGEEQWVKSFEGDTIHSVLQTSDGGYVLAGDKDSDFWLVKLSKEGPVPTALFRYNPGYTGANQTITFDASASYDPDGNITNYQWDFGDGNLTNTTEKIISHSYDLKGKYYVVLTLMDNDGAMNSTGRELTVQKLAPPVKKWDRTFGGTGDDRVYSMWQTSDGGYILAGTSHSYIKGHRHTDARLVKTDPNGNFEWEKFIRGRESDEVYSIVRTNDGGFLIAGRTYDADSIWIMKSDFEGNEQWNDTFGGYGFDRVKFSDQTSDGGFIFSGSTASHGIVSHSSLLVRTDPEGSELWNMTYGGTGFYSLELFSKTRDGGYLLGGITSPLGSSDVWLVRTDSEGVELWNRTFGDPDSNDRLYSFQQTSDGGYIAAGKRKSEGTSNDIWVMKTDSKGKLQWQESFGGTGYDVARSVLQTLDGGYIIGGDLDSCSNEGIDFWLIKLGGISGEPEGGNIRTDGEPVKTPNIPGFSASVSVLGLMVCVGLARRRR
ncbi:MAG: PKD domain-containing protein [Methanosarcinales archaeon]|nr:PKD domain-containing protein [Methanosarcinales archaeon]